MSLKKQLSSLTKFNSARLLPDGPLTLILIYFHGKGPFHTAGACLQSPPPLAHAPPVGKVIFQAQLPLGLKSVTASLQSMEQTHDPTGERCKLSNTPTQPTFQALSSASQS